MSVELKIYKALNDFDLDVEFKMESEVLSLLGGSGCGKSMTLKCIAGIETPDEGYIRINRVTVFDSEKKINLPPQKRHVGLMFQNYALFPNMTVRQNIMTGIYHERKDPEAIKRVDDMITNFNLDELSNRKPNQISGGQQQRTALARIMVSKPEILLLDEPFSALDSYLRFNLEQEVMEIIRDFGKSVIVVSHDRDEVYRLSDKIAVMDRGRIDTMEGFKEVFRDPVSKAGAVLTGCKNISHASKIDSETVFASDWGIKLKIDPVKSGSAYVGIRAHDILFCNDTAEENSFRCKIVKEIENPFSYTIYLLADDPAAKEHFSVECSKDLWGIMRNAPTTVRFPKESLIVMEK